MSNVAQYTSAVLDVSDHYFSTYLLCVKHLVLHITPLSFTVLIYTKDIYYMLRFVSTEYTKLNNIFAIT